MFQSDSAIAHTGPLALTRPSDRQVQINFRSGLGGRRATQAGLHWYEGYWIRYLTGRAFVGTSLLFQGLRDTASGMWYWGIPARQIDVRPRLSLSPALQIPYLVTSADMPSFRLLPALRGGHATSTCLACFISLATAFGYSKPALTIFNFGGAFRILRPSMHFIGRRCLINHTAIAFSGSCRILSSPWPGCARLSATNTAPGLPGHILLCREDLHSRISSIFDYARTLSRCRPTTQPFGPPVGDVSFFIPTASLFLLHLFPDRAFAVI